jgi:hypothetical protein
MEGGIKHLFDNIGLHTELLSPLSVALLVLGAILGYGGKFLLKLFNKKPSDKAVLIVKLIGFVIVLAGMFTIFRR